MNDRILMVTDGAKTLTDVRKILLRKTGYKS
jgi:hypothetical protein